MNGPSMALVLEQIHISMPKLPDERALPSDMCHTMAWQRENDFQGHMGPLEEHEKDVLRAGIFPLDTERNWVNTLAPR